MILRVFFRAQPLQGDLLDWQFVLLGNTDSPFEGGIYHGRILLDAEYPMKPPRVMFLTESGRFEVNVPICLSITSHHAECWQPTWDIRTALTAIRTFMETPSMGAIGALDWNDEERQRLAALSRSVAAPPGLHSMLRDCEGGADEAQQVHLDLHRAMAKAAGINIAPPAGNRGKGVGLRIVAGRGGVLARLLQFAGVVLLKLASLLGGLDLEAVVEWLAPARGAELLREVCGREGAERLTAADKEAARLRFAFRVQVFVALALCSVMGPERERVSRERLLHAERAADYKEQQRLEALAEREDAEERAEDAKRELELTEVRRRAPCLPHQKCTDLMRHPSGRATSSNLCSSSHYATRRWLGLPHLVLPIHPATCVVPGSFREGVLEAHSSACVLAERPLEEVEAPGGETSLSARGQGVEAAVDARSVAEAEAMLAQLADGPELDAAELQRRLGEAKSWAARRLAKAQADAVRSDEEKEKEARTQSKLKTKVGSARTPGERGRAGALCANALRFTTQLVDGELNWLKQTGGLACDATLDATVPKWLQDWSGIS